MDRITALRAVGQRATKQHTWTPEGWATVGYQSGTYFRHTSRELDGIRDLYAALTAIEGMPEWYVIRGDVRSGAPELVRRTYKPNDAVPVPAVVDADRHWLCLDIDGAPADERCHVTQALELLPAWLRDADCVWQYSASHGVKPANQIRLHLWFWLERPVGNVSLRRWADGIDYVDPALFNPVQPHYTARPVFVGAPDPIGQRIGLREGDADVAMPPWPELLPGAVLREMDALRQEEAKLKAIAFRSTRRASFAVGDQSRHARWVREDLDALAGAPEGRRHAAIYRAAQRIASLAHVSDAARTAKPDLERIAVALLAREGRQDEALRRVDEGWADGLAAPRAIDGI